MSDYQSFEGKVVSFTWGENTYTVLPLPPEIAGALAPARRVEGEIAEHPVNLAISKAPVLDGVFLWTGQSLLKRIGIAPGTSVEVRLRPAPDDVVEVPDDVMAAIVAANTCAAWEDLTPGRRRAALYQISTAQRAETRAKRIAVLVNDLTHA